MNSSVPVDTLQREYTDEDRESLISYLETDPTYKVISAWFAVKITEWKDNPDGDDAMTVEDLEEWLKD